MVRILIGIEPDSHRNTLYNFHIIAGGIFRRKKAKPGAGCSTDRFNSAAKIFSISIHLDGGFLSHLHAAELRLFKVDGGPDVIQVHDGKQWLTRLHSLSWLNAAFAQHASYRSNNLCVLKIQLSLGQRGDRSLDFCSSGSGA